MWATLSTDDLPRRWPLPEMDQAGTRHATPMTQGGSLAELQEAESRVGVGPRKDQGTRTLAEDVLFWTIT